MTNTQMRYKIECKTLNKGTQLWKAYVKVFLGWQALSEFGYDWGNGYTTYSRNEALAIIDKHQQILLDRRNSKVKNITIEYITKP